ASRDQARGREPQAGGAGGPRLGDRHAAGGDPPLVDVQPGQAGPETVEAQAHGDRIMKPVVAPARSWSEATRSYLMSRSQGSCPPRAAFLHAPVAAFQTAGGGENQLIQTARHLESLGVGIRLFCSWTDRIAAARLLHLFGMSREGLELAQVA